jgi:hypothetical protein
MQIGGDYESASALSLFLIFIFIGLLAFLWVEASHLKGSLPAGGQQTWRGLSHTHSHTGVPKRCKNNPIQKVVHGVAQNLFAKML